jgi:hypothetical protein
MSRELNQHSLIAHDLFDRDGSGFGATWVPRVAANEEMEARDCMTQTSPCLARRANISEDLWEDARRRHCDARQNWRSLLDRFVKPHH